MSLLGVDGLTVRFGGVRALDGVSFTVPEAAFVGLIGPNGAGKTTLIDAVSGFVPYEGRVHFQGHELGRLGPHLRAHRGLARTWQSLELFDDLTVEENCRVAADRPSAASVLRDLVRPGRPTDRSAVDRALELVGLRDVADRRPHELSLGRQKLVGVARALAAGPRLILLDEPAAGLDTRESGRLGEQLARVVEDGVGVLLVDHDMGLVLGVCEQVHVLEFGQLIASGPPDQIRADERVLAAYLGERAR